MKNYRRFFLYVTAMFVMALAASQITITSAGAATCCSYGVDCVGTKCCTPEPNEVACSPYDTNYCRSTCDRIQDVSEEPIKDVPEKP